MVCIKDTLYSKVGSASFICDPLYENHAYSAKKEFLSYGYSLVEETFLFLKRPLV